MADRSYAGLYYPFIHFKDERWLKLSAFWTGWARITPRKGEGVEGVSPGAIDTTAPRTAQAAHPASWGHLPCHEPRRPAGEDFCRRPRP